MIEFALKPYIIGMLVAGIAVFGAAWLPRVLAERALSFPIIYVLFGWAIFSYPADMIEITPLGYSKLTEHLTELTVIISLMGAGLRISRKIGWQSWNITWRLLGITMPLTIIAIAGLGWYFMGLDVASAVLLGAVLAPTDPVLASDVQAEPPGEERETSLPPGKREVTFSLTSEAGLNDGLAFPFTNMAIAMALVGVHPQGWWLDWVGFHLIYKIVVGLVLGLVVGRMIAYFVFRSPSGNELSKAMEGSIALAATLIAYATTELAQGYGFLAVFVAAFSIRHYDKDSEFQDALFKFSEDIERLLMALLLILLGGSLVGDVMEALTWQAVVVAFAVILLVRPLAGFFCLIGKPLKGHERIVIAFFGIRGIGSIYYVAYAVNHAEFAGKELVWATVLLTILVSIVIHGVSVTPMIKRLERRTVSG
jgi:NhaP-type Na+/H+ or K+/H+ antiporter